MPEKRETDNETKGEMLEEYGDEGTMTHRHFVRGLHQKTHAVIIQSMQEMCKNVGEVFVKQNRNKGELRKPLMDFAVQRERT